MPQRTERAGTASWRSLQLGAAAFLLSLMLALVACQPNEGEKINRASPVPLGQATEITQEIIKATSTPERGSDPALIPTHGPLTLCVPSRWLEASQLSIEYLSKGRIALTWQAIACEDPAAEIESGLAQFALIPGEEGIPAGSAPLALVVPFGSSQSSLTLEQARQVLDQGSSVIEVLDWRDVTPQQMVLRIDGLHPSDAGYPLQQSWSLLSAPGYEDTTGELAQALSEAIAYDPVIKLTAVGDIMLDRRLGELIASGWVEYPFEEVADLLGAADLTVGNLESALGDVGEAVDKGYTFQAPPGAAQTLVSAGFDLLSLANNHILDYGVESMLQTMQLMRENGIVPVGAGVDETAAHMPFTTAIHGYRLAVLAYVDVPIEWRGFDTRSWAAMPTQAGVAWADPERIRADVAEAVWNNDLVIVLLHSGNEYIYEPSAVQVAAAQAAIEAGAHLVLGHHAHVVQGLQFYAEGVIAYGLGNFAFTDGGAHNTILLNVWLDADGVRSLEAVPLLILYDGRPSPAEGAQAQHILQVFFDLCEDLR